MNAVAASSSGEFKMGFFGSSDDGDEPDDECRICGQYVNESRHRKHPDKRQCKRCDLVICPDCGENLDTEGRFSSITEWACPRCGRDNDW